MTKKEKEMRATFRQWDKQIKAAGARGEYMYALDPPQFKTGDVRYLLELITRLRAKP